MTQSLLAFGAAALCEIAGCFAFWMWLRRGASPLIALVGVGSLIAFVAILTKVDTLLRAGHSRKRLPKALLGTGAQNVEGERVQIDT